MREVSLILLGEPMPKQSVRKGKNGFFQPIKYKQREQSYRMQILQQLPKDFVLFENYVEIQELIFVFRPTLTDLKHSKKRAWLESGGFIPKTTKPDLIDNLPKLLFDSMSKKKGLKGGVFVDDARVARVRNSSKEYGINPRIEIKLIGY